ncbi:MAG: cysteine--tRNA ligase [Candidatus Levybacteria bacterium]|nr:cysteine--tRNA ligase [Candidatus Levybacteria bacterium]
MLKIYNSLSRKKEIFSPLKNKEVKIYVCGITPYDTTHLGHAFAYISYDVLVRYLTFKGHKVTYTQNVTDINDRDKDILERAKEQNIPWQKLADFWTKRFLDDMKSLNWIMPTNYIKASENIPSMINLIQKLLDNGFAYKKNGNVYFDISKKKDFGKLSKLNALQMMKLAKEFDEDIENLDKRHPLDITLWRAISSGQSKHIPSFESPFGPGRPGWHIECSAMSMFSLGDQIDIHGGGIDLIYPHHESEIAQSEGASHKIPFAKYWAHTSFVSYRGKKMSKSLGNLVMVSNLLRKYSSNAIKWMLLSHHYRKPWEFYENDIILAEKSWTIIENIVKENSNKDPKIDKAYMTKFINLMNNDMNTPAVLSLIFEKRKNISKHSLRKILLILGFII